MKKIFCLIIALILVFSMCAVTTSIAFAEEAGDTASGGTGDATTPGEDGEGDDEDEKDPHPEVIFHQDVFDQLEMFSKLAKIQSVVDHFKLDNSWAKDEAKVAAIFENINYHLNTDPNATEYTPLKDTDRLWYESCAYNREYKDNEKWQRHGLGSDFSVASGWYAFRYVVTAYSGDNGSSLGNTSADNEKYVYCRSSIFYIYFVDTTAPEVKSLNSDMRKAMEDGVKVGSKLTIKNPQNSETSAKTVYQVFKKVDGVWDMNDPIYDSSTKVVKEGYEDCISTSGVITMLESDVLPNNEPVYKIIYTITDNMGYTVSTLGTEFELTLFAVAVDQPVDTMAIWQIVLYVIAGLSAVGIVVVLCIKPKDPVPEGRTAPKKGKNNSSKEDSAKADTVAENSPVD